MKASERRRVELHAESLKRIAKSGNNDFRRFLLTECLEAYSGFDVAQRQELASLMETEPYREAKPLMVTTFERGIQQGKIEALREMAIRQLDARFGPLPPDIEKRVSELTLDQLQKLMLEIVKAGELRDLSALN